VANPHIFSIVEFLKIHYNLLHNKSTEKCRGSMKFGQYIDKMEELLCLIDAIVDNSKDRRMKKIWNGIESFLGDNEQQLANYIGVEDE